MEYNIVTSLKIVQLIKKSKYFKVSLGYANYVDDGNNKVLSDKDKFAYYYNSTYKTNIQGQGLLASDISVYTDHYITKDYILIYFNKEEFKFEFDFLKFNENGIDWCIGNFLKQIEEKITEEKELIEKNKIIIEKKGDPYKVINNPGQVTFEDIKAYQDAKRKGLI